MAKIYPFQALRYTPQAGPLASLVTQPYDKISPAMQARYLALSPYNLVHLILGERKPEDNQAGNVYTRAAAYLNDWIARGVLARDAVPAIFPYFQDFTVPDTGERLTRKGFIALGAVEDYSAGIVHRHEQTLAGPKKDRLELLRHTHAHFGQIFMLYPDRAGEIDALLEAAAQAAPLAEVTDEYGVGHRMWRIDSAARIQELMADKKLLIADGHHRYETALTYRNERRAAAEAAAGAGSKTEGSAPYDSVMMTFVDMDCPGLVILPTHRLVSGLPSFSAAQFQAEARKFFVVEEVDADSDAARATTILRQAGQAGAALLAVTAGRIFLLHSPKAIGSSLFGDLSLRQQALDVVQLHKCLLEAVLKISEEAIRNQENVFYCREAGEALAQVQSGKAQMAFLMNPARMEQVRDIAFAGEVLPQKSTDFFPKLLSGLTIYGLE